MTQPKLKHAQIIRLGRLLDMMYCPAEIADEIGVSVDTIYRSWLPAGCPHRRDKRQHIWIHGPALVAWAHETIAQRKRSSHPLGACQGWCLKCNRVVTMTDPVVTHQNRYIEITQAPCPQCGTPVNRARKRARP